MLGKRTRKNLSASQVEPKRDLVPNKGDELKNDGYGAERTAILKYRRPLLHMLHDY